MLVGGTFRISNEGPKKSRSEGAKTKLLDLIFVCFRKEMNETSCLPKLHYLFTKINMKAQSAVSTHAIHGNKENISNVFNTKLELELDGSDNYLPTEGPFPQLFPSQRHASRRIPTPSRELGKSSPITQAYLYNYEETNRIASLSPYLCPNL